MAALSEYMSAAAGRALPAEVVRETKHHILDTIAAMVSAALALGEKHGIDGTRFIRAVALGCDAGLLRPLLQRTGC